MTASNVLDLTVVALVFFPILICLHTFTYYDYVALVHFIGFASCFVMQLRDLVALSSCEYFVDSVDNNDLNAVPLVQLMTKSPQLCLLGDDPCRYKRVVVLAAIEDDRSEALIAALLGQTGSELGNKALSVRRDKLERLNSVVLRECSRQKHSLTLDVERTSHQNSSFVATSAVPLNRCPRVLTLRSQDDSRY